MFTVVHSFPCPGTHDTARRESAYSRHSAAKALPILQSVLLYPTIFLRCSQRVSKTLSYLWVLRRLLRCNGMCSVLSIMNGTSTVNSRVVFDSITSSFQNQPAWNRDTVFAVFPKTCQSLVHPVSLDSLSSFPATRCQNRQRAQTAGKVGPGRM